MVENLPSDSASVLRERGHDWQQVHYLLADIGDAVRYLYALTAAAHGAKNVEPTPIDRPGDAERRADQEAQMRRAHDDLRARLTPGR